MPRYLRASPLGAPPAPSVLRPGRDRRPAPSRPAPKLPAPKRRAPTRRGGRPVDLSGVCPETIVIQTDWCPEGEYGATYGLLGSDYEVDADNKIVSGPLTRQASPPASNVEIRAGGSAIGVELEAEIYTKD